MIFSTIDWQSTASEIEKIKKRQSMLMNTHQKSGQIQKDLQRIESEMRMNQELRDKHLKEAAILTNAMQELAREIEYCEKTLKWV